MSDDEILPIEIDGRACCLCGWPIPTHDIRFTSPYIGRYLITLHCPVCGQIWDAESKDSETIYESSANKAAIN